MNVLIAIHKVSKLSHLWLMSWFKFSSLEKDKNEENFLYSPIPHFCIIQLSMTVSNTWDNLFRKRKVYLAHGFRCFTPWAGGYFAFRSLRRGQHITVGAYGRSMWRSKTAPLVAKKQKRESKRSGLEPSCVLQGNAPSEQQTSHWTPLDSTISQCTKMVDQTPNTCALGGHLR